MAATLLAASSVSTLAVSIDGVINFTGTITVVPNASNLGSSTGVNTWLTVQTPTGAGTYNFANGSQTDTMAAGWTWAGGSVFHMWKVVDGVGGGNTGTWYFNQSSSSVTFQDNSTVVVHAVGTLTGPGYDPTPGIFNFLTQTPASLDGQNWVYTFSASAGSENRFTTPDGGTTVLLLGSAFVGLGLLRKKLAL